MKLDIPIVNAFVDQNQGGNPAGVVLNAEQFSSEQKLAIAAAVGLSETAFVSPSSSADYKLEFFTPTKQIAHCGHATVATFGYLRQIGKLPNDDSSKETIDGRREIKMSGEAAYMEQLAPTYIELSDEQEQAILDSLNINRSDLLSGQHPTIVHTGNAFMIVPLRNEGVINSVRPQMEAIAKISEQFNLIGYYLYSPDVTDEDRDASTRMFAPFYGITEESATGMAAGPLACYLYDKTDNKKSTYLIEQGHFMSPASPSVIDVQLMLENEHITGLMAGGHASVSATRTIEI